MKNLTQVSKVLKIRRLDPFLQCKILQLWDQLIGFVQLSAKQILQQTTGTHNLFRQCGM
jgi:hypothetical protein